jgi:uncharacterized C2H2 Zn-finger protein
MNSPALFGFTDASKKAKNEHFSCAVCRCSFSDESEYERHILLVHAMHPFSERSNEERQSIRQIGNYATEEIDTIFGVAQSALDMDEALKRNMAAFDMSMEQHLSHESGPVFVERSNYAEHINMDHSLNGEQDTEEGQQTSRHDDSEDLEEKNIAMLHNPIEQHLHHESEPVFVKNSTYAEHIDMDHFLNGEQDNDESQQTSQIDDSVDVEEKNIAMFDVHACISTVNSLNSEQDNDQQTSQDGESGDFGNHLVSLGSNQASFDFGLNAEEVFETSDLRLKLEDDEDAVQDAGSVMQQALHSQSEEFEAWYKQANTCQYFTNLPKTANVDDCYAEAVSASENSENTPTERNAALCIHSLRDLEANGCVCEEIGFNC